MKDEYLMAAIAAILITIVYSVHQCMDPTSDGAVMASVVGAIVGIFTTIMGYTYGRRRA